MTIDPNENDYTFWGITLEQEIDENGHEHIRLGGGGEMNDLATIPRNEYEDLASDSAFLECLKQAGVEEWEGYKLAEQIFDTFNRS